MAVMYRTDNDIQRDVLAEFLWDPRLEPNDVGVEVDDGIVTLSGTVESLAMKLAAEQAAQRVSGVRAVANDLSVHTAATWNDTDIAESAANAIEANGIIPADRIDIAVKNGKISLTGEVDWEFQRAAAMGAVHYIRGVRDVVNLITLKPRDVSAIEVKSGIERALVRAAELDANRIHVLADGDHVTLTGTVATFAERQAAVLAAWNARGVHRVTNKIEVRPN